MIKDDPPNERLLKYVKIKLANELIDFLRCLYSCYSSCVETVKNGWCIRLVRGWCAWPNDFIMYAEVI